MENPNPPVRTCVLRVGIKCCKGCQTNAKRKLLNVTGVNAVEHNEEQGLLTVSGNVNPTMLLRKLTKWGKKAEIVTVVVGDSSTTVSSIFPDAFSTDGQL
ncbi:Heavy metal-associated isoprenylated plant protein 34 [Cardamine amara subsp. amara]|uniref:Heavy metal-associated isoprenylated plant protein 34 n=1 Tax=Cardamine amara subsp. amara TaxID=228776 RepID=A0ABD1BZF4_CARAN